MRTGISITVKPSERKRLKAILNDRNAPQKHAWRAEIILLSAEGLGTNEIIRRTKKSKTCVWRWQERFMVEGVGGLLRDKTRPSRIAPLGPEVAAKVVAMTQEKPPGEVTHWTGAVANEKGRPEAPWSSLVLRLLSRGRLFISGGGAEKSAPAAAFSS